MPPVKRRILCIESHTDIRLMLCTLLTQQGFKTDSAATVADALKKAQSARFSLYVVSDRYVDGTNVELVRQLRSLSSNVPILIFSTQSWGDNRQKAIKAGAQVYLTKPEGLGELLRAIHSLCGDVTSVTI